MKDLSKKCADMHNIIIGHAIKNKIPEFMAIQVLENILFQLRFDREMRRINGITDKGVKTLNKLDRPDYVG